MYTTVMDPRNRSFTLGAGLFLAAVLGPASAAAYTDLQILSGGGFSDTLNGNATADGMMNTLTLEHAGPWDYGDHFFFLDMVNGKFVDASGYPTGVRHRVYGEWFPRASFSKMTGKELAWGPIKDVYLAGGLNMGSENFFADLSGVSFDLAVPGEAVLAISFFSRDDNINRRTYQISPSWSVPFKAGPLALSFDGFMHVSGLDSDGPDVIAQPQLLLELSSVIPRLPKGVLMAGIEWYHHANRRKATDAPQALLKWTW